MSLKVGLWRLLFIDLILSDRMCCQQIKIIFVLREKNGGMRLELPKRLLQKYTQRISVHLDHLTFSFF